MYYELTGNRPFPINGSCPACGTHAHIAEAPPTFQFVMVVCGICGKFRLDNFAQSFLEGLRDRGDGRLYKVSYFMRRVSEGAKGIRDNSLFPIYSQGDLEGTLDNPAPSIQERFAALLKYLSTLSGFPGDQQEFDAANDYSVLCAKNLSEANFYMFSLYDQGFLVDRPLMTDVGTTFSLSAGGWIELERLAKSGNESSKAFVAMWFNPSRRPFFDAMSQAIKDAGYLPIRVDLVEHVNRIDDEIISQIRQSKFLVADLSGQRNGVYFEAGFMQGLERPVIWTCEKSDLHNVHFDTRQFNTIDYEDSEELRICLQFRIESILGKGPHREG